VRDVVRGLRDEGTTVLLTTHDLAEAERLADHVLIIDRGRLVAEGPPDVLRSSGDHAEIRFSAEPGLDTHALGARLDATVREVRPGDYVVSAPPSPTTVAAITSWLAERDIPLADLRAGRQTLEDVFLRLTSEDPDQDRERT
jgi:ABC-2 type transport system ATP-binding protein